MDHQEEATAAPHPVTATNLDLRVVGSVEAEAGLVVSSAILTVEHRAEEVTAVHQDRAVGVEGTVVAAAEVVGATTTAIRNACVIEAFLLLFSPVDMLCRLHVR